MFTGQRAITALGIYHYQARFYSPSLGRFLSADTIVPSYANPQSLNRYAYANNNPLYYTDPSGHWAETVFDVISLGMTINDIRNEGWTVMNTISLVTDVASIVIPFVPAGVSHALRAAKLAN
ncbi:MAG TPA: RHS repeat-associated core domain-containing protein, partial [Anaerolineales bacterium]|nr:RHS repeat-associated core domain-containing protein [Anaerolineales bacterium]